jgi:hypothetical protein
MVTVYLLKGIHTIRAQQDKIATFKFRDFNLGDCKNHSMLTPYKYLTRTKGKNSENNPPVMDDEHRAVHPIKCNENPTLWKAPEG